MDQIIIKDILARGIIGVNDSEPLHPQDILVNVVIFTDTTKAGLSDNINDSVNYRTITKQVISLAEYSSTLNCRSIGK